jgi:MFS family permease
MWGVPTFVFLFAFFHRAAPGAIAKDLMQDFGATAAVVGLLAATYFYSYAGFMIPAGVLIDAYGPRLTIAAGGAVMAAGTIAMALATDRILLFGGRFVVGLGATVTFIGAIKIAAAWFPPTRFGTMSAITATVGVFGGIVSSAPLAALAGLVGWRGAFWVVGLITLGGAVACAVLVRDRPDDAGAGTADAPGLRVALRGMGRVLANPHTWPPFLAFFGGYAGWGNLMLWAVPYLKDVHGLSTTRAAVYATIVPGMMLISAPLTGWLSDEVLRRRKLPYVMLAVASLVLWTVHALGAAHLPLWGIATLWVAMGVAHGCFVLTWPIGREVNPPELAGMAVATVNLGGFVGAALSQGLLGAVLDANWAGAMAGGARVYPAAAYGTAFGVCVGFALLTALATLFIRESYGRNVYLVRGSVPTGRQP